jgi:hypothetical protein
MFAIDKYLRNRGAATGTSDHLVASRRFLDDIDLGVWHALAFQETTGTRAIRTEHRRIKLYLGHCWDNSDCGRVLFN